MTRILTLLERLAILLERGRLSRPRGVFVDQDGLIYVADTGNSRVAVSFRKTVSL